MSSAPFVLGYGLGLFAPSNRLDAIRTALSENLKLGGIHRLTPRATGDIIGCWLRKLKESFVVAAEVVKENPQGGRWLKTELLDGEWAFRFSADETGERERWYEKGAAFPLCLHVPGGWEAQGVGEETEQLRRHAVGVGWYRRMFDVPADWAGKRIWLHVGGAHRSARVWINEQFIDEHWGYPVAFRYDVTEALKPGVEQTIVIAVDSRRHPERDPLSGTFDLIDYMNVDWGGIFEHVWLECTEDVWIADAFVQPDPAHRRARVEVTLGCITNEIPCDLTVAYVVRRWSRQGVSDKPLDTGERCVPAGGKKLELALRLKGAPLWTPEEPNLLVLQLSLRRAARNVDTCAVRFGQRLLEACGDHFYLNGERFFLRGYGDDWTFPCDLVPPADVGYWREYFALRKSYGFNGVRHHSTIPPASLLAAADEVGMLVQPELPIGYLFMFDKATERGRDLYRSIWKQHITQLRNHPSVMAWCMGNELYSRFPLAGEFYQTAKSLDPTRLVLDSDGTAIGNSLDTVDYVSLPCNSELIPWGKYKNKYDRWESLDRPVVIHEMGNLCVLPDPADVRDFTGVVKPFWLEPMRDAVKAQQLESHLPAMMEASQHLQASLIKLTFESARLSAKVAGYHYWLFRDYWTQSSGIVNHFDTPRQITPAMARPFNSAVVLLWDHNRVSYQAGEPIELRMFLSDFRPAGAEEIGRVQVHFSNKADDKISDEINDEINDRGNDKVVELTPPKQAGARGVVGPWTGSMRAPEVTEPQKRVLIAEAGSVRNAWSVWVFPRVEARQADATAFDESDATDGVIRARCLTADVLDALAAGARVWVTDEKHVLPTTYVQFKTAYWKGDGGNTSYGTMIVPHVAMDGFPHDGYGDLQMSYMLDERPVVLMDELPQELSHGDEPKRSKRHRSEQKQFKRPCIEPIIWCIDVPWRMSRRAYMFEARVGKGRLLVSTLNLSPKLCEADPAAAWMCDKLLSYVRSDAFQPKAELSLEWLRQRVRTHSLPDRATWLDGFDRVVEHTAAAEPILGIFQDWTTFYPVRQTDGQQKLCWQTAKVPTDWPHETVTFVFRGALGARWAPGGEHFNLAINGKHALDFTFTQESKLWSAPFAPSTPSAPSTAPGAAKLFFDLNRPTDQDSIGLFLLTVDTDSIEPGKPVTLTVTADAHNSQRYFAIIPEENLL